MSSLTHDEGHEIARPSESQRDPVYLCERLDSWLKSTVGDDAEVTEVQLPSANGMSSETLLADARWGGEDHALVVRVAPLDASNPIFPSYDLDWQFNLIKHVAESTDVPVPQLFWSETSSDALGAPFFVMARVDGRVPPDVMPYTFGSWVTEATAEERDAMVRNTVGVLARIHATPLDGAPLALPNDGETPLRAHLRRLREFYDWASARRTGSPLIERAFAHVEARLPEESEPVLSWGDARIGNVMYDGFEPVAVLDWEMATVGPRELDLAWMVFLHRFFQDITELAGLGGLPDFLTREQVAAEYSAVTGYHPRDLDFYTLYAALIHAAVMYRVQTRAIAFGQAAEPDDPDDMIMHRTTLEAMLAGTYWENIR
ncbi:phosphotransferase family protein [Gordonia iterans]|uniref:Phosphotransferase family protein n=1 Tax=Gordonia iterans TaxID=1004901 RepID=A0A2S0KDX0_9ACTN|nr:phosphotransferase family protein [Gordonia iterans]AVL99897.1 phosphotransferase family protein [Gordonia iterans]